MAETIRRGKIRKPIAPEIVQYISAPIAEADFQTSYDTMLDVNRAHVLMLVKQGIIDRVSAKTILQATEKLAAERIAPDFVANPKIEDLYTSLEQRLIAAVGLEVGGRQHTARSRNDLGATVVRLDTRAYYLKIATLFLAFRKTLLKAARDGVDAVMSGYTHMQPSEPITFGHWASGVLSGLARDYSRFSHAWEGLNLNPLGACSMGSTSFPIDRAYTSRLLGFDAPLQNSIDSVATRDYAVDIVSSLAIAADTLSRMAFDLYIWSTPEYGYVEVDDSCAVCSSIMPQKKNPDVPELARGKTGRVNGHLVGLLTLMKGQPLAYNKDNQEDKEPLFDTVDTVTDTLRIFADMIGAVTVRHEMMRQAALQGYATATDLADYLVKKGLPFRDAHEAVARAVRYCVEKGCDLSELTLEQMRMFSDLIESDVLKILTLEGSVGARDHIGGTAPAQVKKASAALKDRLGR